jgi:predicted PurR-regulated permease PerM
MDQNQKMLELLERMEKNSRKQVFFARVQFILSAVALLCCIVLLLSGMKILPQLQNTVQQTETVISNLESVTTALAQADLANMVNNVDGLVTTSQEGIEQAMEKIDAIDIEALNQAIKDLSDVINPISNFFNKFKIG